MEDSPSYTDLSSFAQNESSGTDLVMDTREPTESVMEKARVSFGW